MQKRHFEMETDGFYGAYWKCKTDSDCAMIAMIGDDSEDYLACISVKWLHKLGVNVMTMSRFTKSSHFFSTRGLTWLTTRVIVHTEQRKREKQRSSEIVLNHKKL